MTRSYSSSRLTMVLIRAPRVALVTIISALLSFGCVRPGEEGSSSLTPSAPTTTTVCVQDTVCETRTPPSKACLCVPTDPDDAALTRAFFEQLSKLATNNPKQQINARVALRRFLTIGEDLDNIESSHLKVQTVFCREPHTHSGCVLDVHEHSSTKPLRARMNGAVQDLVMERNLNEYPPLDLINRRTKDGSLEIWALDLQGSATDVFNLWVSTPWVRAIAFRPYPEEVSWFTPTPDGQLSHWRRGDASGELR